MDIAKAVAMDATCERGKVGCVLVLDGRGVAFGRNGSISGHPHCTDEGVGCHIVNGHCERCIHAEQNCLLNMIRLGIGIVGIQQAEIWCTHQPCFRCYRMIVQVGIKKIVYNLPYEDKIRDIFLDKSVLMVNINEVTNDEV